MDKKGNSMASKEENKKSLFSLYIGPYLENLDQFLSRFKFWTASKEVKVPILIFIITRIAIILGTWFGITLLKTSFGIKNAPNGFPYNLFLSPWTGWDAGHYAKVVSEGYVAGTQPFFPLYPFLTKIVDFIFHNARLSGFIVSNIAFLFALIILYKLVTLKFDKETAERAVLYLSIFPTTFFFICGLTEATFLLVSLLTFYYAEKEKWGLAGLFGVLTTLTRSTGFLIAVPIFLMYAIKRKMDIKNVRADIIPILLIPSGLFIFMLILILFGHHPLDFIYVGQKTWPRIFAFPLWDLGRSISTLASVNIAAFFAGYYPVKLLLGVILVSIFLILSFVCIFKIDIPYGTHAALLVLFALSNPAREWLLYGDLRFILVAFPIFILIALYGKNKFLNYFIVTFSLILLPVLSIFNGLGGWIS